MPNKPVIDLGSDGNDFSGLIIYKVENDGLQVLIIDYTKEGRLQIKFPGGCMAGEEDILDAACSELEQETDLRLKKPDKLVHVWTDYKVPGVHHKHFFAVKFSDLSGTLRTKDMFDDDEKLSPPRWVDAGSIHRRLFPSHRIGLEKMIAVLGSAQRPEYDLELRKAVRRDPTIAKYLSER